MKDIIFSKRSLCSFFIALIFTAAATYGISLQGIIGKISVLFVTYLLALVITELYEYIIALRKNAKYSTFFHQFESEGIDAYYSEFTDIDIKGELKSTRRVCLLEIYSSKNIINNYDHFKEYLSVTNNSLDVILLEADETDKSYYQYLTLKFGYNTEDIRNRVNNMKNELIKLKKEVGENCGRITLYYSKYIPQYSLIIFDSVIYITFYKTSPGRSVKIPVFKIRRLSTSSLSSFLLDDFESVLKSARKVEL